MTFECAHCKAVFSPPASALASSGVPPLCLSCASVDLPTAGLRPSDFVPLAPPVTEGRKDDAGKTRFDLVPPDVEEALAKVLTKGAAKYGARNWEQGFAWGRAYAAARRHLRAFWAGEDVDTDSGDLHLAHALCSIAFLLAFQMRKIGTDDRPRGGVDP